MKTTIIRSIALPLVATFMAVHAIGQKTDGTYEVATKFSSNNLSDKSPFSVKTDVATNPSLSVPYNRKVFEAFHMKFFDATDPRWEFEDNGSYHAFFKQEGHLNAILFNKNGKIIYLVNYLSEDQLPSDVKNLINDNYEDYKITNAAKVLENNRTIWVLNLTGVSHWIKVVVEDGDIQRIDKYKLSN